MLEAFRTQDPVIPAVHSGRRHMLPKPLGMGHVVEVREGTNTKREFVVDMIYPLPSHEFKTADLSDPGKGGHCWIKRQFMRSLGLEPVRGTLMRSFVECRIL